MKLGEKKNASQQMKTGLNTFDLTVGGQPGMYNIEAWVNSHQAGKLYLKAYEVTQETPLSESRLSRQSEQQAGWSNSQDEVFLYARKITIYEGDWNHPYAARFELWFKPDSGQAERKLTEKIYKIEGWQH